MGTAEQSYEEIFRENFERILQVFRIQNEKYQDSWINDGFDVRVLLAEVNAKFRRLKGLLWDNFEKMKDPKHRAKIRETSDDLILYLLFLNCRADHEFGPIPSELLKQLVDRT